MMLSGATFVRNAIKFDYPVVEAIRSILPICDEFVVNVGESEDQTLELVSAIGDPKIRIIVSKWDDNIRTGGKILADQTNIALNNCRGDWIFYIQADEVVHEKHLDRIRKMAEMAFPIKEIEGLLFDFKHFFGSHFLVKDERGWYRREIRIIRNGIGVTSWKDAQGFRIGARKLRVVHSGATVYHYGHARNPAVMQAKQMNLDRYWHDDNWIRERYSQPFMINLKGVVPFDETPPEVMKERIAKAEWDIYRDPEKRRVFKRSMARKIFSIFDCIGEYRNYRLITKKIFPET